MHVLLAQFYSSSPTPCYDEIARGLRARGHTVWVGTPDSDSNLVWHDGERDVAVQGGACAPTGRFGRVALLRVFSVRLAQARAMARVRRFIRRSGADVVQVNPWMGVWLLPLAMPPKMRFVLDIRQIDDGGGLDLRGRLRDKLGVLGWRLWTGTLFDITTFCHEAAAVRVLGPGWQRLGRVIPVGIDQRFLDQDTGDWRCPPPGEPVRFCYPGTLSQGRRLETILSAAQMLAAADGFVIDLIGPDESNGHYRRLVGDMGLNECVRVLPPVPYESIPATLARYDVALAYAPDLPAWRYQPMLKTIECRALGLPMIATDVASSRDWVQDGVNGLLVPDDAQQLADAMARFIADRGFLQSCRASASDMRIGLTWSDVAGQYVTDAYVDGRAPDARLN